jgi:hypothetical protein
MRSVESGWNELPKLREGYQVEWKVRELLHEVGEMNREIKMSGMHVHMLKSVYWFGNEMIKIQPIRAEGYKFCTACGRMVKEVGEAF